MTLSQAVDSHLHEPPPLQRLRTKIKPPSGYVMYGPKDAPEAIAEYLQAEDAPVAPTRAIARPRPESLSVKARQNKQELDEAVYLYSDDPDERRALKGHGKLQEAGHKERAKEADSPVREPSWHAQARTKSTHPAGEPEYKYIKKRSQLLRKVPKTSSGSGMQYRPREEPSTSHSRDSISFNAGEDTTSTSAGLNEPSSAVWQEYVATGTFPIGSVPHGHAQALLESDVDAFFAPPTCVRTENNRD